MLQLRGRYPAPPGAPQDIPSGLAQFARGREPQIMKGDKFGSLSAIYQLEIGLMPLLTKMHLTGVRVD